MFEEEEDTGNAITHKILKQSLKKHSGYTTPELNDVLYLHYLGIGKIQLLEPYINVKALWLNNNAINRIENISALKNLTCLYLQNNIIEKIEGLEELTSLKTLVLSSNYILKIENLSGCKELNTLEIDHNRLSSYDDLKGLVELQSLSILNLSHNKIENEDVCVLFSALPQLRVLRLEGNQLPRKMENYRRKMIIQNNDLRYLDDAPIEENDRRLANAWAQGGKQGEKIERENIKREADEKHMRNMEEFKRIQREALLKSGGSIDEHPELIPDDEVFITSQEIEQLD